jgi:hypothetical protein
MGSHGISEDSGWELYRLRFDVRSYHDTGCLSVWELVQNTLAEPPKFTLEKVEDVVTRFCLCVWLNS